MSRGFRIDSQAIENKGHEDPADGATMVIAPDTLDFDVPRRLFEGAEATNPASRLPFADSHYRPTLDFRPPITYNFRASYRPFWRNF